MAIISLIMAIACIFIKTKKNLPSYFDGINIFAAKGVFSRGVPTISAAVKNTLKFDGETSNKFEEKRDNNIELWGSNPVSSPKIDNKESNMALPKFDSGNEEEKHSPNEKTYKVIESQFGSSGQKFENFFIKNTTGQNINFAQELSKEPEIKITKTKEPQVLIFHTHTSEAYMNRDEGFFYESYHPRSVKDEKNVTRVSQAITDKLIENGINTIHNITYHDTPGFNGSYVRAANTIRQTVAEHPSIQVVIDVHRDGIGSKETGKIKPTFKYKDKKAAQVMFIAGCDPDGKLGFPNWGKNLRLALRAQKYCEDMFPGMTRPLNFAKVKYNQHITKGSMLVEVGSDVNTLEEAVYTGSMLGEALAKMLNDLKK